MVVVTVQYRFGPFGYLDFSSYSTDERTFDSNVGIRDHLAALEWVQRNIAAFGGDPGNVTIFGESAGGSAVLALLASPASKGAVPRGDRPESRAGAGRRSLRRTPLRRCVPANPGKPRVPGGRTRRGADHPERARQLLTKASAADLHKAGARLLFTPSTPTSFRPYPTARLSAMTSCRRRHWRRRRRANCCRCR